MQTLRGGVPVIDSTPAILAPPHLGPTASTFAAAEEKEGGGLSASPAQKQPLSCTQSPRARRSRAARADQGSEGAQVRAWVSGEPCLCVRSCKSAAGYHSDAYFRERFVALSELTHFTIQ